MNVGGLTSNYQLHDFAKKLKIKNFHVYSKDKLTDLTPDANGSYIINMADSTDIGSHWVCIYFENGEGIYFDSFGILPPLEVIMFMEKRDRNFIYYSMSHVQNINSGFCGQYCLYFLLFMQLNKKINPLEKRLKFFLAQWSSDPEKNLTKLKKVFPKKL